MIEERWETMARVAKGLQMDDPVNWPHYADEAARLVRVADAAREVVDIWTGPPRRDDADLYLALDGLTAALTDRAETPE